MLEFLQTLYGKTEDGQPQAMTWEELEAAATASKIKAVNLADGGYVSKDKYDADVLSEKTKADGLREQLNSANAEIKSYKDMDIEGIKSKASEWEDKYNTATKELNDKLERQERDHQRDLLFAEVKFASRAAKSGMMAEFDKQDFVLKDGVFQGAEAWLAKQKEEDPASFLQEEKPNDEGKDKQQNQPQQQQQTPPLPTFATSTSAGSGQNDGQTTEMKFHFGAPVRRPKQ